MSGRRTPGAAALLMALAVGAAWGQGAGPMEHEATGVFEATVHAEEDAADADGVRLGRMRLDKRYSGDLEAVARGRMLTAVSPVDGSSAYTAIERVSGSLDGRVGSFVLAHFGIMDRGVPGLEARIVPDSGAGGLSGIRGRMEILAGGAGHRYRLVYSFPDIAD
ncbi:MAG: DUF3224 domain-containing protein [Pseudoxanthomonas sp.]|nr:DUF3224 domain-containing protein [Pseudoxanthomonas sp.]